MRTKKMGSVLVVRIDRGEEIIAALKEAARQHGLRAGIISGIGAAGRIKLGLFETAARIYRSREFRGDFEIAHLGGNLSVLDGEIYLHLHAVVGDKNQGALAGHLEAAVVSATAEITIIGLDVSLERKFDPAIGLNLLKI